MNPRADLAEALERGDLDAVEEIMAKNRRAMRFLVGYLYRADAEVRELAAQGIARAARHHPKLVQEVLRRLVWAMNEESGANAPSNPAVMRVMAEEQPALLVPMIPDLLRLTRDEGLHDELVAAVQRVAEQLPEQVAPVLNEGLRECMRGEKRKDGRRA